MRNIAICVGVIAVFAFGTSAVVWTGMSAERSSADRSAQEHGAAEDFVVAVVARESALRGYALTHRKSFLESYDEATGAIAAAADQSRRHADGGAERRDSIEEQVGLAARWAASANDSIIGVRDGEAIPLDTTLNRIALVAQLRQGNAKLRELIERDSDVRYRRAVQRSVLLVVLLSLAFALAGVLLLHLVRRADDARRALERTDHASRLEFSETLQVTESEAEAHALVKRHLERSVPGAEVLVLNRNNSQNRLEASTPVAPGSAMIEKLIDSAPASCLAVRLGRPHARSSDAEPLLQCTLCSHEARSTCLPSLVGGEVIGSVLVSHGVALSELELTRISESVSQAAPVLANLRNLAVAEIRAATDGLTGLPNARSVRESLVRLVAQSSRSSLPLSAILCDLDHFKQINDVYGHDRGDEALAAASAVFRACLRTSDLAGRYGGEEFLVLLPDTQLSGAIVLAEKLREQISLIEVPGVDRAITASFGVASFPDDAADGEMLVRMADRALYGAKARGRNCVVTSVELLAATAPS